MQIKLTFVTIFVASAISADFATAAETETSIDGLPVVPEAMQVATDYLVQPERFQAGAFRSRDGKDLILDNGLVRRAWRLAPNGACVGFDNRMSGQAMLRSVRPEARVTIDGVAYEVGGLKGQPNHAFLTNEWLGQMQADPNAMMLTGYELGKPQPRFDWGRRRHASPDSTWPPKGIHLRMDYGLPSKRIDDSMPSSFARPERWLSEFVGRSSLPDGWQIRASNAHERTSFVNEGKAGEIYAPASAHCFAERKLSDDVALIEAVLNPGTDTATSWGLGIAWVFEYATVKANLRPGDRGEHGIFELRVNGQERLASPKRMATSDGGLDLAKSYRLRMRSAERQLFIEVAAVTSRPPVYEPLFHVERRKAWGKSIAMRVGKMDRRGNATDETNHLGDLVRARVESAAAYGKLDPRTVQMARESAESKRGPAESPVVVSVHYELYDGVPVMSKWITVHNRRDTPITVDRLTSEELALVEQASWVETRDGVSLPRPQYLHVETDFCFGGMNSANANRHVVHWRPDPLYFSQVNYAKQTPCLLVCEPTYGPAQQIGAGEHFEGFRVFELAFASEDREHRGLAYRKMYRAIAPWVTENPITHHLLSNDPQKTLEAIDKAADVGFEAIILSFGSGFNMENRDPEFLAQWKAVAEYAKQKNIELGCYSLLSSRAVGREHMSVLPDGQKATHGRIPSLASEWGQNWLRTVRSFYRQTGFAQFENDGPWPGDIDVTPRPPIQRGLDDSRWALWQQNNWLYRGLREDGVYINQPDFHFLNGGNKGTMGYREVNWSLPRAQQVIHTRQNIYDGTWQRTPSMGWMHVPLSQYHGGGAAATIEPLHEHRDHYRRMLESNLGMGVQAHYRGPRLYDTLETRETVKSVVDWFKEYRGILESDIIHGRRADGRDLDWVLHANPKLAEKGMLCVYNPRDQKVTKTLRVNLYYTGLTKQATLMHGDGREETLELARDHTVEIRVTVPANAMRWYVIR